MIGQPSARGFLFISHGESTDDARGIRSGGDVDPPLSERGYAQAAGTGLRLAALLGPRRPGVQLIAPPLRRALDTARIIAMSLDLDPEDLLVVEGFRERRLGQWNGLPIGDAVQQMIDPPSQQLILSGAAPDGGESEADFRRRVLAAADEVARLAAIGLLPLVVSGPSVGLALAGSEPAPGAAMAWPAEFAVHLPGGAAAWQDVSLSGTAC